MIPRSSRRIFPPSQLSTLSSCIRPGTLYPFPPNHTLEVTPSVLFPLSGHPFTSPTTRSPISPFHPSFPPSDSSLPPHFTIPSASPPLQAPSYSLYCLLAVQEVRYWIPNHACAAGMQVGSSNLMFNLGSNVIGGSAIYRL